MDEEGREPIERVEGSGNNRIDRRKLIKRGAIGAGGLWAAPAILSLSPALAHHQASPHAFCGGKCCPGQDNSCFADEGCYCDEACQSLGDCCPDFDPSDCGAQGNANFEVKPRS